MVFSIKTFLVTFLVFLFSAHLVFAQNPSVTSSPKTTFEAFWPMTAGKTVDDSLYFLKIWKETLRGIIVFGNPQKAEYAVYLGTKRILEADKLFNDGKKELADKTLDKALEQFNIAEKNISVVKTSNRTLGPNIATMKPRLDNLLILLPSIPSDKMGELLQKVKNLQMNI